MFLITGVPYKRIMNKFLGKDWGMKIVPYNRKFLKSWFHVSRLLYFMCNLNVEASCVDVRVYPMSLILTLL